MELDAITNKAVKDFLRGLRSTKDLSYNPLLTLDILLDRRSISPAEKILSLKDILRELALAQLHSRRKSSTTSYPNPYDRAIRLSEADKRKLLLQQFKLDCRSTNHDKELRYWSTLYHYYLLELVPLKKELALIVGTSERNIGYWLADGIKLVVRELRQFEKQAHEQFQGKHLFRNLPSYDEIDPHNLVGVAALVDGVVNDLSHDPVVRIVSLEGIGGIGKTAAALAVAHQIAKYQHFENIVWVSARQKRMTLQSDLETLPDAVETYAEVIDELCEKLGGTQISSKIEERVDFLIRVLPDNPYLVVIDNLETLGDVVELLPTLEKLSAGASKFLLTTRHSLNAYAYVKIIPIPELSYDHSHQLLCHVVAGLSSTDTKEIYELIGGIPLIIHLVAGQIKKKNLATVLNGLKRTASQVGATDNEEEKRRKMFDYIYKTTWLLLSDDAEVLMLAIGHQMVPTGAPMESIQGFSSLDDLLLSQALEELIDYHLVTVLGTVRQREYSIHRFTQMFVRTQFEQPSP